MKELNKIIDLKSFITITLVVTLELLVIIFAVINSSLDEKLFLLFSNITTMVITYYFSKGTKDSIEKEIEKYEEENKNESV